MKLTCTGRKVSLKEAFLQRAQTKLAKLDKFFSPQAQAQVTVTVEKDWQTVEITVKDRGLMVRSERSADAMEQAFDEAADTVVRQVVKNRKKLNDRLRHGAQELMADTYPDVREEGPFLITREKNIFLRPVSVEEAILQMNLVGHAFYMFLNAETDQINVVYRRKAGDYGLLVPEE